MPPQVSQPGPGPTQRVVHVCGKGCANLDPDLQRRCDNPDCLKLLTWREGRGRPQRFCSDRCRQRAVTSHRRLLDQSRELSDRIAAGVSYRQERRLKSERSRVEWLLSAYPPTTE